MLSASSYGHFTATKEFRSQCKVLCFEVYFTSPLDIYDHHENFLSSMPLGEEELRNRSEVRVQEDISYEAFANKNFLRAHSKTPDFLS